MDGSNFLSREQIDSILEGMTARDIFAAMPSGTESPQGANIAGEAFERAAERQGHGKETLDRVRAKDSMYLASALSEAFAVTGPKDDTAGSPPSPDSGD